MKSVMRYQRGQPDICGGEPHLFMGRRTGFTHTSQAAKLRPNAGGVQMRPTPSFTMSPHCQDDRWIDIFYDVCSVRVDFQEQQHETEPLDRKTDRHKALCCV